MSERNRLLIDLQDNLRLTIATCARTMEDAYHIKFTKTEVEGALKAATVARGHPITPPKGEPMPQTREYWEKRADMDHELIRLQRDEINALKQRINQLQQLGEEL